METPGEGAAFDQKVDFEARQQDVVERADDQLILTDGQNAHVRSRQGFGPALRRRFQAEARQTTSIRLVPFSRACPDCRPWRGRDGGRGAPTDGPARAARIRRAVCGVPGAQHLTRTGVADTRVAEWISRAGPADRWRRGRFLEGRASDDTASRRTAWRPHPRRARP